MKALFLLLFLISVKALAFDFSALVYQPQVKSQDENGDDEKDPLSFGVTIGHQWAMAPKLHFAPRLSYIKHSEKSRDSYSDYKVQSYIVALDVLYLISDTEPLYLRLGVGNFIKEIKGEGGTTIVPNGSGTAVAYRPSGKSTSQTAIANLGVDWRFDLWGSMEKSYGTSFSLMFTQPTDSRKTYVSYLFHLTYYL